MPDVHRADRQCRLEIALINDRRLRDQIAEIRKQRRVASECSPQLSVAELAALGYRIAIFPQTAFRVAMRASEEALQDLKQEGTQKNWLTRMQTRQDLYYLLRYDPKKPMWKISRP